MPSLLLSWIATDRITDALDRLRIPGLEETLSTSSVIGAELVDRLNREADIVVTQLGDARALDDAEHVRRDILESRALRFSGAPGLERNRDDDRAGAGTRRQT